MILSRRDFTLGLALAATYACGGGAQPPPAAPTARRSDGDLRALDPFAIRYVKLVLSLGRHDDGYVDAYYGPEALRAEVESEARTMPQIGEAAAALAGELAALPAPSDPWAALRLRYLTRQTGAVAARVRILGGEKLRFDDESEALYDARAPAHEVAEFERVHAELAQLLPGKGDLGPRLEQFRKRFVVPVDKLAPVFEAAIAESRRRTLRHIALPANERVTLEFVTGKHWGGYNWYRGGAQSLVQINTDLPIFMVRALDVASHESYPGHHVYNVLLEEHLVKQRGFVELSVYPLYSPQSLVAEGSANYGIEVAFPDRAAFLREVLFPIAGFPPDQAALYVQIEQLDGRLDYVDNEAARGYLDARLTREQAVAYLVRYGLTEPLRAQKFIDRTDVYRTYLINYNHGRDLIASYVDRAIAKDPTPDARWMVFRDLLASPRLPADLR